uniref:DUF4224 domain-containing protein n=1 Tax=Vibrio algicola TaxID=2662262 RepID=A0A5Q0TIC3_9VIBR
MDNNVTKWNIHILIAVSNGYPIRKRQIDTLTSNHIPHQRENMVKLNSRFSDPRI